MVTGKFRRRMGSFFAPEEPHESAMQKGWNFFGADSVTGKDTNQPGGSSIDSETGAKEDASAADKTSNKPQCPRVVIKNDVGDLIGSLNEGATIEVDGSAGNYAGEGMIAGELTIEGDVRDYVGSSMRGGTIFVKGNAENYVGHSLKGGTIIVGGSIGDFGGAYMISGAILVCGKAGRHLGTSMIGGTIYVKGRCRTPESTAEHKRLTAEDRKLIGQLVEKYHLNLNLKGLKKVGPKPKSPI